MQSYITVIMRNILYRVGSDSFREKHKERDRGGVEVNNIFQILHWPGLAYCWLSMRGWLLVVTCWKYRSDKFPRPRKKFIFSLYCLKDFKMYIVHTAQSLCLFIAKTFYPFPSNILFIYILLQLHRCIFYFYLKCFSVFYSHLSETGLRSSQWEGCKQTCEPMRD